MDVQSLADILTGVATICGVVSGGYIAVRRIEGYINKSTQKSLSESNKLKSNMEESFIRLQSFNGERYREINQGLYELRQKYEQDLVRLGEADKELENIVTNLKKYVDSRFTEIERLYESKKRDTE